MMYIPPDYQDDLRQLYRAGIGLDEAPEDPNYECLECGWQEEVEDYQQQVPNWCRICKEVRTFDKLDKS